jgi:hypothetical protein
MITSVRRHPRLTTGFAVATLILVLFVLYEFTPTYLGALFHR